MMVSVEMSKDPKLLDKIEQQLTSSGYTPELARLAKKLLSVNPQDRLSAAQTLVAIRAIIRKVNIVLNYVFNI